MTADATPKTRFHLSLNVSDIDRAVAFYSLAFDAQPAKRRADYAKFELDEPPLVLSLEPARPQKGGAFNHAGFRLTDVEALVAMQRRLEESGVRTVREEGVECCYAKQSKFWLQDPDDNLWEFYVLEGDIERRGSGQVPVVGQAAESDSLASGSLPTTSADDDACCAGGACESSPAAVARKTVRHFLGQPVEQLAGESNADEVFLQGSLNAAMSASDERRLLQDAFAATAPGGTLRVHCLTAATTPDGSLDLSGPAAVVQRTPVLDELLEALAQTGFVGAELTTYRGSACFHAAGTELRETMLVARKPAATPDDSEEVEVLYKGPLRSVRLDSGTELVRGRRTIVSADDFAAIRDSDLARSVVRLDRTAAEACG